MRIRLVGPHVNRTYVLEKLTHVPDCCYLPDDKGLPMIFALSSASGVAEETTYTYRQVESVLQLQLLQDHFV
jgi:hypothetical protein